MRVQMRKELRDGDLLIPIGVDQPNPIYYSGSMIMDARYDANDELEVCYMGKWYTVVGSDWDVVADATPIKRSV